MNQNIFIQNAPKQFQNFCNQYELNSKSEEAFKLYFVYSVFTEKTFIDYEKLLKTLGFRK